MAYSSRASFLAIAASLFLTSASALELTASNFAEMTAGKTVFLKFYAPWCGHCKAMAGDWAKLEKDFEGHAVALVGSVDCTDDENDQICEDFNVEGFPTLAWGDASSAEQYEGGRDYESLKEFADEHVTKPVCSIFNVEVCSDKEKAEITAMEGKTDKELLDEAKSIADMVKAEEKKFEEFIVEIQMQYELRQEGHDLKLKMIKEKYKYKYLQMIMSKRGITNPVDMMDDDDDDDDDMMGGEL